MASGRFISRSISSNEQLASVSFEADYLFTRCIPHLDVDGRLTGNPALIKSAVLPLRAEITVKMIPKLIEELAAAIDHNGRPLVVWYEGANGQKVLEFPGFGGQQTLRRDREAHSKFPPREGAKLLAGPPESRRTPVQLPEDSRSSAGGGPAEGEEEVQVQVQEEQEEKTSPSARAREDERDPVEGEPELAASLPSNADRNNLTAILTVVGESARTWVQEITVRLAGEMSGHPPLTIAQLCEGMRDYIADGKLSQRKLSLFRRYLETAAKKRLAPSKNGAPPNDKTARDPNLARYADAFGGSKR